MRVPENPPPTQLTRAGFSFWVKDARLARPPHETQLKPFLIRRNHLWSGNFASQARDQGGVDAETRHLVGEKAAMKRCAQCHGKLGLGVRSRNLWNGRWWVHVRFCSVHCEALYK